MFMLQIVVGNLMVKLLCWFSGEMGLLMMGLKLMCCSLGSIVGDVNWGIEVVILVVCDIVQGNEDLFLCFEQQVVFLQ